MILNVGVNCLKIESLIFLIIEKAETLETKRNACSPIPVNVGKIFSNSIKSILTVKEKIFKKFSL
jgi:hypothetical protein